MSTTDPRHVARALALQQLFAELVAHQPAQEVPDLLKELDVTTYDEDLTKSIVEGVKATHNTIDNVITTLAPAWPIDQIAPVDLTLLRMGMWEGFIAGLTPVKVVINEMIELAKQFGGSSSRSFVNGVLGALVETEELQKKLKANNNND